MTVQDVLDYLASGMSAEQIVADFPDLTSDDIRACMAFAAEQFLLSVPQKQELQRRLDAHAANPSDVVPCDTVRGVALSRFRP